MWWLGVRWGKGWFCRNDDRSTLLERIRRRKITSSPEALVSPNLTEEDPSSCISLPRMSHARRENPHTPPCRLLGGSFADRLYVAPSSWKEAPAMRFATLPITAPK